MGDPFDLDEWEAPELGCSQLRLVAVAAGQLASVAAAAFIVTTVIYHRFIGRS